MIKQFPIRQEYPDWFKTWLNEFNKQNLSTTDQLNEKTSFDKDFTFKTLSTYSGGDWTALRIKNELSKTPSRVTISQISQSDNSVVQSSTVPQWSIDGENISVNWISGLADSTSYKVRFKIE